MSTGGQAILEASLRRSTALVLLALVVIGCAPAYVVDAYEGTWSVASIDGETLGELDARLTFGTPDPDTVRLDSACGSRFIPFVLDSDSDWLEFYPADVPSSCPASAGVQEASLVAALADVDRWSVRSEGDIALHGSHEIVLTR